MFPDRPLLFGESLVFESRSRGSVRATTLPQRCTCRTGISVRGGALVATLRDLLAGAPPVRVANQESACGKLCPDCGPSGSCPTSESLAAVLKWLEILGRSCVAADSHPGPGGRKRLSGSRVWRTDRAHR